ncbi:MAG TPA: hypothetical protein VFP87_00825 [Chitinophagaceae bacterium]|nr:hypothetical protein [Chitinophagaceae bacterium]
MRPFDVLDKTALVNALADYTNRYTKLLTEGGKEKDIINCRETMQSLIAEIESRKTSPNTVPQSSSETEGGITT